MQSRSLWRTPRRPATPQAPGGSLCQTRSVCKPDISNLTRKWSKRCTTCVYWLCLMPLYIPNSLCNLLVHHANFPMPAFACGVCRDRVVSIPIHLAQLSEMLEKSVFGPHGDLR